MSKAKFKAAYPKANLHDFAADRPTSDTYADWVTKDTVIVAEYWVKEPIVRTLGMTADGKVHELGKDDNPNLLDGLGRPVYQEVRKRKTYAVRMYKINGCDILEGPTDWPTPHIPVIAVLGQEIQGETSVIRRGIVRNAVGAQRRLNYWITAQTEWLALQPKAPFIASDAQIEGYEADWANANDTTDAVLI